MELDFENSMNIIEKQFICGHELTKEDWERIPPELSLENQKLLFDRVHDNELNKKYPLAYEYQMEFYKRYIQHLELTWIEVHDDIYYGFCDFKALDKANTERSFYRHYTLEKYNTVISIKELRKFNVGLRRFVSTELYRFQGSVALSDWLLHNEDVVKDKCVLEIGSNTGLCSIISLKCCNAEKVILTGTLPEVVEVLNNNKELNIQTEDNGEEKLTVLELPWETCDPIKTEKFDVILAADVVYAKNKDCEAFIDAIDRLFRLRDDKVTLMMAVLVQGKDMYEFEEEEDYNQRRNLYLPEFLELLKPKDFVVKNEELIPLEESQLLWNRTQPIQLMTITRKPTKAICAHCLK